MSQETILALILGIPAFIFILFFFWAVPVRIWITAKFAGVKVRPFRDLLAMRLRRVSPGRIVDSKITATKAGIQVDLGARAHENEPLRAVMRGGLGQRRPQQVQGSLPLSTVAVRLGQILEALSIGIGTVHRIQALHRALEQRDGAV